LLISDLRILAIGTTQTVVVEHHRDPIPVQEWQQCTNYWDEGKVMCLEECGGTGTYYVGNRLHFAAVAVAQEKRDVLCAQDKAVGM
jgi:hypothetical protein